MDINVLRNFYKAICTYVVSDFTVSDPATININQKAIDILNNRSGLIFSQIDESIFMCIVGDDYHIALMNDDESFNYTIFTRIERHDDSCTYVKN